VQEADDDTVIRDLLIAKIRRDRVDAAIHPHVPPEEHRGAHVAREMEDRARERVDRERVRLSRLLGLPLPATEQPAAPPGAPARRAWTIGGVTVGRTTTTDRVGSGRKGGR
jgi:hypothetical protein